MLAPLAGFTLCLIMVGFVVFGLLWEVNCLVVEVFSALSLCGFYLGSSFLGSWFDGLWVVECGRGFGRLLQEVCLGCS